jgi:hypothetical protein
MMSFSRRQSDAPRVKARLLMPAIGLLLVLMSDSSEVRGETCGHYLIQNGRRVSESAVTESPGRSSVVSEELRSERSQSSPAPHPEPCRGLRCRQKSLPLSVPTPGFPDLRGWPTDGILSPELPSAPQTGERIIPESESGELLIAPGIFRPPAAFDA